MVVPMGNWAGALLLVLAMPQLSAVVDEPSATPVAKHWPALALTVTLAGQVIVGGWLAVTATVCGPGPTSVPAAGDWLMVTTRQLSDATTPPLKSGTAAWQSAPASVCWSGAHCVMIGLPASLTVTCC